MTERLDNLILVDVFDNPIGTADKRRAHTVPLLHRAFSVFLINDLGELLLQKRASGKYHSGGLWANACCSHPRVGEESIPSAEARLMEELGVTCPCGRSAALSISIGSMMPSTNTSMTMFSLDGTAAPLLLIRRRSRNCVGSHPHSLRRNCVPPRSALPHGSSPLRPWCCGFWNNLTKSNEYGILTHDK